MTWSPLPPSFPQVNSRSYTTANTFSDRFSTGWWCSSRGWLKLEVQLILLWHSLGKHCLGKHPCPCCPLEQWEIQQPLPGNRVPGDEEGNSDNAEWPRMCINTQKPLTVLCCDHYKSRKFSRGWFVFPGTPEVSWGAVLFPKDLCNCFWRAPISLTALGPISFPHTLQTLSSVTWDLSLSSLQRDAPVTQDKSGI